jgi:hypothetical protein
MNPDDLTTGTVTLTDTGDYAIVTNGGVMVPMTTSVGVGSSSPYITSGMQSTIKLKSTVDEVMDEHSLNRIAVDHKVTAAELLKLQEVAPDYASEIKENIAKNLARDIAKKVMFKKKHDKDADVHHFIGRVWVFTDDELKELLQNVH